MKILKSIIYFILIFLFLISSLICKKNNNLKENHIDQKQGNSKEEKFDFQKDFYNNGFIYGNTIDEIKKNLGEPKKNYNR